ncbi:MAG: hypothetical protein ABR572_03735, partial [Cryomorphaceae bacterium]
MKKGKTLQRLLFVKELKYLAGYRASNLITLFGISFLSMTAISIAFSSEQFLNYRMNDPFTNWLNVPKLTTIEDQTWQKLVNYLENDPTVRKEFDIASVSRNFNATLSFFDNDLEKGPLLYGETFHPVTDSLLLKRINGGHPVDPEAYHEGIILSEAGLNKLGHQSKDGRVPEKVMVYRTSAYTNDRYIAVPLKVVAVVAMLPDRREFIIHPDLNFKLEKSARRSHLYSEENKQYGFRISAKGSEQEIADLSEKIKALDEVTAVRIVDGDSFYPFSLLQVDCQTKQDYAERYSFFREHIAGSDDDTKMAILMNQNEFLWNVYSSDAGTRYHQNYVVNFSNLKSIRKFSDAMMDNFSYPVDLATVEAKENFSLTSITTLVLVFCLLLFALLSILIFLRSMLKGHLEKIAPNLGTMLAFGIRPAHLMRNYVLIAAAMVFTVLVVSLAVLELLSGAFTAALISFLEIEGADTRVLSFQ